MPGTVPLQEYCHSAACAHGLGTVKQAEDMAAGCARKSG